MPISATRRTKLKFKPREKWVTVRGYKGTDGQAYAVSNFGRVISYWGSFDYGYFLNPGLLNKKYPAVVLRKNMKSRTFIVHRLVAQHFLEKPDAKRKFIIHKDYDSQNNHYTNLKWVTQEELTKHLFNHPNAIKGRFGDISKGPKLTEPKVVAIKKLLAKGKLTMKAIAEKYDISDMQVYRIKSGENWSHVKI